MADQPDFSHKPSGVLGWRELIEQISKIDAAVERHFWEIKSDVDLTIDEGRAKVAKFVLGAANRDPVAAATRFDGHALMFLGVGAGTTPGIPEFEMADLQNFVRRFTGSPGPGWDLEVVGVGGKRAVVVIVVFPPVPSEQPWSCKSEGYKMFNGRIYLRGDGNTREAQGNEVDAILARRTASATPKVDLLVEVLGVARRYVFDGAGLELYIARVTAALLDARPKPKPPQPLKRLGPNATLAEILTNGGAFDKNFAAISAYSSSTPERRTEEQYIAEIEGWANAAREVVPDVLDQAAGALWPGVALKVTNATDTYLDVPEFRIHLDGPVEGIRYLDRNDVPKLLSELPRPPRKWGPTERSFLDGLGTGRMASAIPNLSRIARGPRYGAVKFNNGGSVDLTFSFESLRPRGVRKSDNDDFVLVVNEEGVQRLTGTWMATIKGRDAVYEGELSVDVAPTPSDFTKWVDRQLNVETTTESEK